MTTLEAGSASDVANVVVDLLPESTSSTALELYTVLLSASVEIERRRGHAPSVVESVFHAPLELVAEAAGVSRVTAWRHLRTLRELGLVDNRAHKAVCRGETHNSGTVWRVRLSPLRGFRARLSADDMRHKWRDLDGDVRRGRTSQRAVKLTKNLESKFLKVEMLIAWALTPGISLIPVRSVCFSSRQVELESVLDVLNVSKNERNRMIDIGAQALSTALRDRQGIDWYRRLLWQLLRRYDATGEDYSYSVYLVAQRARTDALEGFARKPGALFVSRLKAAPWFDEVMRGPPVRVGTKPL